MRLVPSDNTAPDWELEVRLTLTSPFNVHQTRL